MQTWTDLVPKDLNLKREQVLALKASLSKDNTGKCSLFELPPQLYTSNFVGFALKSKSVSFEEYATQMGNYEFLKEFNAANNHAASVTLINDMGDTISVNRGFLGLEDIEDLEDDQQKF